MSDNFIVRVFPRTWGAYWISGVYRESQAKGQATKHRRWAYRNVEKTEIWRINPDMTLTLIESKNTTENA